MRRMAALLLLMVICVSACGALCEDAPVYLALGDSITTGYGLKEGEKGFAEIVAEANGYTLINRAVNGNTAKGILQQMEDPLVLADVEKAGLITITCGGNDLMALLYDYTAQIYNASLPENERIQPGEILGILSGGADSRYQKLMEAAQIALNGDEEMGVTPFLQSFDVQLATTDFLMDIGAILFSIKAKRPDASIIVATQYNPYRFFDGDYQGVNDAMEAGAQVLSGSIQAYAKILGYQVAEVYAAFSASEENLCNADMASMNLDFHPNAMGHERIAACVQAVLDGQ